MKSLQQIWDEMPLKTDKLSVHSYGDIYEELLAPYRNTATNIVEVGIFGGASLLLFEKYFKGKVWGIDCDEQPHGGMADLRPLIQEGTHNILIGDATDKEWVDKNFWGVEFQVLIEDSSHQVQSQLQIINNFADKMSEDGLMVIEDIQSVEDLDYLLDNIVVGHAVESIDLRKIKNRYDDLLILIHF